LKKHKRIEIFIEIIDEEDCLKEFVDLAVLVCNNAGLVFTHKERWTKVKVFFNCRDAEINWEYFHGPVSCTH
jgi:hypothetical protein